MSEGQCYLVVEIGSRCFEQMNIGRLIISRTVEFLCEGCFALSSIGVLATEHNSHLRSFEDDLFSFVRKLAVLSFPVGRDLSLSRDRGCAKVDSSVGGCGTLRWVLECFVVPLG
jgi:hypothetical protein